MFGRKKRRKGATMSNIKRKKRSEMEPTWGDVFKSVKETILGSQEDFEDDYEEVEETKEVHESSRPTQKSAPKAVSTPVQKPVSKPAPVQKSTSEPAPVQNAEAIVWRTLQTDLNKFVQSGEVSEPLLQLMEEGFEKNPQLLHEIAELIESRKVVEEVHPGILMEYQGKQTMFSSRERAIELFSQRPGSTIKETLFVSKIVGGKTVETREASEEERRLYYEQQSSKADASAKDHQ